MNHSQKYYKVRWNYYKLRQVLQSAMIITNCDSTDAIHSCLFFRIFFPFIFFDGKFRLFIYSDSNSYLDTEISIISLRFGVLEITLMGSSFGVIFSFVYTVFALFTFQVLVALYGGPEGLYLIFFFFASVYTRIDFLPLKLSVISTAKTAHHQGANNERPKLLQKSYFARHFYAVLKLWVKAFARLYCFPENCWNLQQFRTFPNFLKCKALEGSQFVRRRWHIDNSSGLGRCYLVLSLKLAIKLNWMHLDVLDIVLNLFFFWIVITIVVIIH